MNFVNAFQKIALSLGVLFFGIGVFIYSISPAQADNPTTVNNSGKVQMAVDGFALNGKPAFHILVWDTETGKSKTYNFDGVNKFFVSNYQLPSSPLY
jgi:hypothetical protein